MSMSSVVLLFDDAVPRGADDLPDLGLALLDWVRIGPLTAVRIAAGDFDPTLRQFAGYVSDSERAVEDRRMPAGMGPWMWTCYDEAFEFAPGEGWPPEAEDEPMG